MGPAEAGLAEDGVDGGGGYTRYTPGWADRYTMNDVEEGEEGGGRAPPPPDWVGAVGGGFSDAGALSVRQSHR